MASGEIPTQNPVLHELPYPNELRGDRAAVTYADSAGNLYLEPLLDHDYGLSESLSRYDLSSGQVVAVPGHAPLIRYGKDSDLLPLGALLNSSIDRIEASGDITTAISLVARLLRRMDRTVQALPAAVTLDMFAVDRATGRAELLAPFREGGISVETTLADLLTDISNRSQSQVQRDQIATSFTEAQERFGS